MDVLHAEVDKLRAALGEILRRSTYATDQSPWIHQTAREALGETP